MYCHHLISYLCFVNNISLFFIRYYINSLCEFNQFFVPLKGMGVNSNDERKLFAKEVKTLKPYAEKLRKEHERQKKEEKKRLEQEKKLAKRKKKIVQ